MTIHAAVVTISDRRFRGEEPDESGDVLESLLIDLGMQVDERRVVPDEIELIADELRWLSDLPQMDLILTTGGTGFTPRDNTREATMIVLERMAPGIDEAIRAGSLEMTPFAMLSRGVSGIRKQCLIINLSGSPKAVREQVQIVAPVLPHAIQMIKGIDTDRHEQPAGT